VVDGNDIPKGTELEVPFWLGFGLARLKSPDSDE